MQKQSKNWPGVQYPLKENTYLSLSSYSMQPDKKNTINQTDK